MRKLLLPLVGAALVAAAALTTPHADAIVSRAPVSAQGTPAAEQVALKCAHRRVCRPGQGCAWRKVCKRW
jgi:hypothetical protein